MTVDDLEILHKGHVIKRWKSGKIRSKIIVNLPRTDKKCFNCGTHLIGVKSLAYMRNSGYMLWMCFSCHIAEEEKEGLL